MNEIFASMMQELQAIVATTLMSVATYAVYAIKKRIKQQIELKIKQDIVQSCAMYVEQLAHAEWASARKLEECQKLAREELGKLKIQISEQELMLLIERAVLQLYV
jgi:uncharacterized protein YcgL (UPF0745 family)